jgi:ferric-dicitrate binding protein FerR (iron transport regulator)
MSHSQEFENIIVRFLMDDASEEDIDRLRTRIESDAEFKRHFEQIRDTWQRIELEKELDTERIRRDMRKVMSQTTDVQRKSKYLAPLLDHWIFKAAAIFIVGFFAAWLTFNLFTSSPTPSTVYNTIETPRGSSSVIQLSDGSKITLNAASTLRYPEKFSKRHRQVYLEGEAYFEIAKDAKRQFVVKTPGISVRVFGTSFNIKNYPDENSVETTLVEGSISLYKTNDLGEQVGKEIEMKPDQQVIFYRQNEIEAEKADVQEEEEAATKPMKPKLMLAKRIDTERYTSWKDGQLIIESEPLYKLAQMLERRYDVTIHFEEEKIKQYRFTGVIDKETIEQVMSAIKLASSIDYRIEEREIWITSK